ncbi:MAG: hypothetical protein ACHQ2F_09300 [Desulfobaccales bacterium]
MIVTLITEFTVNVFDRGIANKERIVLFVNEKVNLGQYGLMIGIRAQAGSAVPIRDNMLWFGDGIVNKGDWIFVYTGPGEAKTTMLPNNQERLFSIHWGRKETILHHPDLVPILFRVDAVQIPQEMENLAKIAP